VAAGTIDQPQLNGLAERIYNNGMKILWLGYFDNSSGKKDFVLAIPGEPEEFAAEPTEDMAKGHVAALGWWMQQESEA